MAQNTPLARVKAGHGSKKDLVEKIKGMATDDLWLGRLNEEKSWDSISNAKLLRLYAVLSDAKQRFGTRDKLIDAVVSAEGRTKDADYKKHFASWPLPRLMDALRTAEKRSKARTGAGNGGAAKPAAAGGATETAAAKPAARKGAATAAGAKKGAATAKKGAAAAAKPAAKKGAAAKPAAKKGAASTSAKKGTPAKKK